MSNSQDQENELEIASTRVFKTPVNVSLTSNTLGLVGTSHKGPAFVPQNITIHDKNIEKTGILNTFEDTFGAVSKMKTPNLSQLTAYEWFNQGGPQISFVRVLGLGDTGIPDNEGITQGSGFEVGKKVVSGSTNHGTLSDNSFSNGSYEGRVHFIGSVIKNRQFLSVGDRKRISSFNDYLQQIGFSDNDDKGHVITNSVFCPSGSQIMFESRQINAELDDIRSDLNQAEVDGFISRQTNLYRPKLFIVDLKNTDKNLVGDFEAYNAVAIQKKEFNENFLNYKHKFFLQKGHLNYSSFYSNLNNFKSKYAVDRTGNETNYFVLTGSNDLSTPVYENFKSPYKTAKTPWIVSQPLNREGLDNNRVNLHQKCKKLFRFWSISDGVIGNKYRIRITPQRLGDNLNKDWSKFTVIVYMYDLGENKFNTISEYKNLNLDPNSQNYIGRVFGTSYEKYNVDTGKVEEFKQYNKTNNHLRVEISDFIEFNELYENYEIIPSGFMPYPTLNTTGLTFEDKQTKQLPLEYNFNLLRSPTDKNTLDENKYWGVSFDIANSVVVDNLTINSERYLYNILSKINSHSRYNRNYYYYTKYFQDNYIDKRKNSWVYDLQDNNVDSCNAFFHLEKILYLPDNNDISTDNWKFAMFRRDGKLLSSIDSLDAAKNAFKYLNIEEALKSDGESDSDHSPYLSFDFFTFGGFDGVNILDNDKRRMNQSAFVREMQDETNTQVFEGPTTFAYRQGHKLITDIGNSEIDILNFPEIGHNSFNKDVSIKADDDSRYVALLNVPEHTSEGLLTDYEFYDINLNLPQNDREKQQLKVDDFPSLDAGIDSAISDAVSMYFNNKFTLNFCNVLNASIDIENIPDNLFTVMPTFTVIKSMARTLSRPIDSIVNFNESIVLIENIHNVLFTDTNNNRYSRIIKNSVNSNNNINFIVPHLINDTSNIIKPNSSNSSIRQANSLNRYGHNARIMLDIKKNIKYGLFGNNILFENNSRLENKNVKINFLLNNILANYKQQEIINDYFVSLDTGLSNKSKIDKLNNILRGKVAISLFGNINNNIQEFSISDILNSVQNNLTQESNQNIIQVDI